MRETLTVFGLGPPKCGTLSLSQALTQAGFRTTHSRPAWLPKAEHTGTLLQRAYLEHRDPITYLPGVEAIVHASVTPGGPTPLNFWPQMDRGFLATLRDYHPHCLFLLHWRPVAHWIRSVTAWKDLRSRITSASLPGLAAGCGACDTELAAWITEHWQHLRQWGAEDLPHFLDINIEDAHECSVRLSAALGRPVCWPWLNRSQEC